MYGSTCRQRTGGDSTLRTARGLSGAVQEWSGMEELETWTFQMPRLYVANGAKQKGSGIFGC